MGSQETMRLTKAGLRASKSSLTDLNHELESKKDQNLNLNKLEQN